MRRRLSPLAVFVEPDGRIVFSLSSAIPNMRNPHITDPTRSPVVRYHPLEARVLLLQLLQPPRLVQLQPPVLLPPPVVTLLRDLRFLARLRRRLAVGNSHFNLPQQRDHLLRLRPLPCHDRSPPRVDSLIPPGTRIAGHVT